MVEEFWGTLSIYDHRDPIFVRSLVLFDRIVIPIPNAPFGTLTNRELDELQEDANLLKENNAEVIYEWNPGKFQEWETETMREALTIKKTDKSYATRLEGISKIDELKKAVGVKYVSAAPVYGARKEFNDAYSKIALVAPDNLTIELSQLITVPDVSEGQFPLNEIIKLRNKESFQVARKALRDWQIQKMPNVLGEDSERQILLARGGGI